MPPELVDEIVAGPERVPGAESPEDSALAAVEQPLLLLCVNDTPENGRWECTVRTLTSIGVTADLSKARLWIVDNGSTCPSTARFLSVWREDQLNRGGQVRLFRLPRNEYATYAFNRLLAMADDADYVVRIEDDIEFATPGWPQVLTRFLCDSGFGLVSTKPLDLPEKALGIPITRLAGRSIQVVDEVPGFCTAIVPDCRRMLGALASAGCYIEDLLTSARVRALGYGMAFLAPDEVRCFHVDRNAKLEYQQWKTQAVRLDWDAFLRLRAEWQSGKRPPRVEFELRADDGFLEL